jgi:O-antigen/teichoic acid export membrane protein
VRPRRWLSLLKLTVSFSLATAVGAIYVYTAQILTSLVASAHQSGLFAASFRVFVVAATVPGLLVGGAFPLLARAARDDRERLSYAMQRIFEVSLILGVGTALAILTGAPFIISVVAGPKYSAAAEVLRLLGLALSASFLVAAWGFAVLSLERYRGLLILNATAFLLTAVLTLSLASSSGAKGVAVAVLCSETTLAVGYLFVLVRGHPELRPELPVLPKVLIAAAPAGALALILDVPSFWLSVITVSVYGVLIGLLRAVPREIVELLRFRATSARTVAGGSPDAGEVLHRVRGSSGDELR